MEEQVSRKLPEWIQAPFIFVMLFSMPAVTSRVSTYLYIVVSLTCFLYFLTNTSGRDRKIVLSMYSLYILNFFVTLFNGELFAVMTSFAWLLDSLLYPLVAIYVIRNRDTHFAKTIAIVLLLQTIITCVTTIIGCTLYPGVVRTLAARSDTYELYDTVQKMNVGGFNFIYSLVMFIPLLIYAFFYYKGKSPFKRIMIFLMLSLFVITLFKAEFTISILLAIMAILLMFIGRKVHNYRSLFILSIVLISLVMGFKNYIGESLCDLSSNVTSTTVSARLFDIGTSLQGDEVNDNSDFQERSDSYEISFDTFISNPLGIWEHNQFVGGHSYLLDSLAKFGLLGLLLIIITCRSSYVLFVRNNNGNSYFFCQIVIYLLFLTLALLNPHLYLQSLTFTMPLVIFYLGELSGEQYLLN